MHVWPDIVYYWDEPAAVTKSIEKVHDQPVGGYTGVDETRFH